MTIYTKKREIHISEQSVVWRAVQRFAENKIAQLNEEKSRIDYELEIWHRLLEPETTEEKLKFDDDTEEPEEEANNEAVETVLDSKTERVYSAPDVMLKLGISPSTLTTACKSGRIPHAKDEKGNWCFSESHLETIRAMVNRGELCPSKAVPDGYLGTGEVCMILGIKEHELRELRQRGYINTENKTKQGTPCLYSPEKVDDLAVLFRKKGGARNFIEEVTHERLY